MSYLVIGASLIRLSCSFATLIKNNNADRRAVRIPPACSAMRLELGMNGSKLMSGSHKERLSLCHAKFDRLKPSDCMTKLGRRKLMRITRKNVF
jgi:hypothetical protein